jgi:hypothetical protein
VTPIVVAGGGYLRELHDGQSLVETGQIYYGGVGIRVALATDRSALSRVSLRAEARARWRRGSSSIDTGVRAAPSIRALASVRF